MRPSGRTLEQMRPILIETGVTKHAEGSCLIRCGDTHVLCTATIEDKAPSFLKGSGLGWVTAEYGMLPRATNTRNRREAAAGKRNSRNGYSKKTVLTETSKLDLRIPRDRDCQESCVRGRVDHHALTNLSSNMMAN